MLDPDEVADFEAWKAHKLTSHVDLSVAAYNLEMEAQALAWEAGVRAMANALPIRKSPTEVIEENPYRKPGMRGERRGSTARLPGTSSFNPPIPDEEEQD